MAKLLTITFLNSDSQERGRHQHLPQRRVDDLTVIQISPDHDDRGIGFSTTSRTSAADHHSSSQGKSADYPSSLVTLYTEILAHRKFGAFVCVM